MHIAADVSRYLIDLLGVFPFKIWWFSRAKKHLVGGFNPFEKYESKWESSPNSGENKKSLKPPPRHVPYPPQGHPPNPDPNSVPPPKSRKFITCPAQAEAS